MKDVIELAKLAGITFKPMTIDGVEYQYRHVRFNDNFRGGFDDDEATCIETLIKLVRNAALTEAAQKCRDATASIWDYHEDGREEIGTTVCNNLAASIESLKEPTP